jgi:glycosyltransferase involved in cell wall biosynthesis
MMCARVSVIIPVFNTRAYLSHCLESIAAQSLAEFEAIIVDDGSTDDSPALAEAFCRSDGRFRLLRHGVNRGLAAARNTGVRAARAAYVAQVDSDDTIAPGMLAALHGAAIEGDLDVVACGYREVDEDGRVLRSVVPEPRSIVFDGPPRDIFAITDPSVADKLWRRAIFTDNDLWFAEGRRYEDLGWTYRALLHCRRIRILDLAPYDYRLRRGSQTHSFGWNLLIEHVAAFELLHQAMTEAGLVAENAASFRARVRASLAYHARKVCDLSAPSPERLRYLRGILAISRIHGQQDDAAFTAADTDRIIAAIDREPPEPGDDTIAAQRERIRQLEAEAEALQALARMHEGETAVARSVALDLASTMRGPIFLLRPLATLCDMLGKATRHEGLRERARRMRAARRGLAGLGQRA